MPVPFETMAEVRDAHFRHTAAYCRIAGVPVEIYDARISHGVDQPVGTARFTIAAPRPAVLELGADVEIELGYFGLTRRRFYGSIPQHEYAIDEDNREVTVQAEGRCSFLRDGDAYGLSFSGPITLKNLFRGACRSRSIDNYFSEETRLPSGGTITLGGVQEVDAGDIRIDSRSSPLSVTTRAASLFGYRVYDRPDGQVTQSLVSGIPNPKFDAGIATTILAIGDYVSPNASINVRDAPTSSGEILGIMASGSYGIVAGDTVVTADGLLWQEIRAFNIPAGWSAITAGDLVTPRFTTQEPRQPLYWMVEGLNAYGLRDVRSSNPMVTYFDVRGARYQTDNGITIAIRSIPEEVPSAAELRPLGYRMEQLSDVLLVTPTLAAGCRECQEIDRSEPYILFTIETQGEPEMQPGEIGIVDSPDNGIYNAPQWLMRVDDDYDEEGEYTTTVACWSGGGEALEAGDDCITETISNDVFHFGDENLSWYRDPSPDGTDITVSFTVPYADYSSAVLEGYLHGANTTHTNTPVEGSKFEIWQLEDPSIAESGTNELRRVGTIDMPSHPEELSRRRNYGADYRYWQFFRLPMPGNMLEGAAYLHIVSGEYDDDTFDDGEVTRLRITYCGVGIPDLPGSTEIP